MAPRKLCPLSKDVSEEKPYSEHRICCGRPTDRFLLAGYMRGDLGGPDLSESIWIGRHRTELQPLQEWVLKRGYKLTERLYLS